MPLAAARTRLTAALTGDVRADEPMSRHTSFRIGGPAALFVVADTLTDVSRAAEILEVAFPR